MMVFKSEKVCFRGSATGQHSDWPAQLLCLAGVFRGLDLLTFRYHAAWAVNKDADQTARMRRLISVFDAGI